MSTPQGEDDAFLREAEKQAERRRRGRQQGVWHGLAQVGAVGWMICLPTVGGALLGRWLDHHYATGIFWTLSLLTAGLALGCSSVWRSMSRELSE